MLFPDKIQLNPEGFLDNLRRKGTPDRVYCIELGIDPEVENIIDQRYGIASGFDSSERGYEHRRRTAIQRFLGYEYVNFPVLLLAKNVLTAPDTTLGEQGRGDRTWQDEHKGPISSWEDFEKYPWPNEKSLNLEGLEWYQKNLPDDMILIGRTGHFYEYLTRLMGYENLCFAIFEQPELVQAVTDRCLQFQELACRTMLQSSRTKIIWASDDMGFKTGSFLSPEHLKKYVFPGHRRLAQMAHDRGCLYLLHSCGNRKEIMDDLIDEVKIDGIHSWEDEIELITDAKRAYGHRVSLLGGIDVDFLSRSSAEAIRKRTRKIISACQPGGGFCLGSGNGIANYVPVDHFFVMLEEARAFRMGD